MFYENSICLECGGGTGFDPEARSMLSLEPVTEGVWRGHDKQWKFCANLNQCGCNWLLPANSAGSLCAACQTTRTIPDLSTPFNQHRWQRLETAKRRLLYTLLDMRLWGPECRLKAPYPLVFEFLEPKPDQPVLTGHQDGVITINIVEADDDQRERVRLSMYEPYRTLLGHLRHEVGHYFWDVLIKDTKWQDECRKLFGDDLLDYGEALKHHYANGPTPNWAASFVSAYATMHPWEDWAETWAHCLHMNDTLETADQAALSTRIAGPKFDGASFAGIAGATQINAVDYALRMSRWVGMVMLSNEISRSMGQPDVYPFALTLPVLQKLFFIDRVIKLSVEELKAEEHKVAEQEQSIAQPPPPVPVPEQKGKSPVFSLRN